jgi:cellulose 1,4-beta-cellobiosidase
MISKIFALGALLGAAAAQQVGTQTAETHPRMTWQKCSSGGSCTNVNGEVTIDSNWRWVHDKNGYTNCYDGNTWNTTICSDGKACASNCALDGADYPGTYGASTSGNALTLKFVTKGSYCRCTLPTCPIMSSGLLTDNPSHSHEHRLSSVLDGQLKQVPDVHSAWQRIHL